MFAVFTYGTLMSGMPNNYWLDNFTFDSYPAIIKGYDMYDVGGFPALVKGRKDNSYEGELLLFDEKNHSFENIVSHLDILEGCRNNDPSSLYLRELVKVKNKLDKKNYSASVYIWNRPYSSLRPISDLSYRIYKGLERVDTGDVI